MTDGFATRLSHVGRAGAKSPGFVNPAVERGSTLVLPDMAAFDVQDAVRLDRGRAYGTHGNPTHFALEDAIAAIEGGTRCQIVPTGLMAVTLPLLAYLSAGDHLLVPDSLYGPGRKFCRAVLERMGIAVTFYRPGIDAAGLAPLFRPATRVLYLESPGSHSFEIQDVPALAAMAHARGATVMLDNTWGVYHFQPFTHGVDVSIQAVTKYIGGHSDLLLGAVTVTDPAHWARIRETALLLGVYASPDDCWLALRGARTLGVRLARHAESALAVATWLRQRPEIHQILYPALPGAPGHDLWKRDFTGACGLFGVEFVPGIPQAAIRHLADTLRLFAIGESWGGYESLIVPTHPHARAEDGTWPFSGAMCRLHIGLEDPADLIADLEQGLAALQ